MEPLLPAPDVDAEYVALAQEGDRAAFDRLAKRHHRDSMAAAGGLLRNAGEAEDAVQEALLRAWESITSIRDPRRFKAWLAGILYRVCQNRRRRFFHEGRSIAFLPRSLPDPSDVAAEVVQEALALPTEYRDVLVLFYLEGMIIAELAETIGITEANVKVRLHRARRLLRERLHARGIGPNPHQRGVK